MLRDSGVLLVARYSQYLVTIVVIPIVAHSLGVLGFAHYSVAVAASFFGSTFVDLGLTAYLAALKARGEETRAFNSSYAMIRLVLMLFVALAVLTSLLAFGTDSWVSLVSLGVFVGGLTSAGQDWIMIGERRYKVLLIAQLCSRLLYLGLIAFTLRVWPSVYTVLVLLAISNSIGPAITWLIGRRLVAIERPTLKTSAKLLRVAAPLLANRLLANAYQQGAAFLFPIASQLSYGLLAASDKLIRAAQSSLDALSIALIPRLSARSRGTGADFWSSARASMVSVFVLGTVLAGAITVIAPVVVPTIFGHAFTGTTPALQIEAWLLPAGALTSVISTSILIPRKDLLGLVLIPSSGVGALVASAFVVIVAVDTPKAMAISLVVTECIVAAVALSRIFILRARDRSRVDGVSSVSELHTT